MDDIKIDSNKPSDESSLTQFKKICAKYNDSKYVYKKCRDGEAIEWIVVLEKIMGTMTNEERKSVHDASKAKFRASKLDVVAIFNLLDPSETENKIISEYFDIDTIYEVGKTVYSDKYDHDIEKICSNGIHYFNTIEPAYFYIQPPKNYTGIYNSWYENGEIMCEGSIIDGLKSGKWTRWHINGSISWFGEYISNNKHGKWEYYTSIDTKTIIRYDHGSEISKRTEHY
jgi:hypothetical protein